MLPLELALKTLLNLTKTVSREKVSLADSYGRILAENIVAAIDFPPFDRSPLDGYAVIASEVSLASKSEPVSLKLIESIPAGGVPTKSIIPGTTARIMTGAPLPQGASGVVRVEDTRHSGDRVIFFAGEGAERNICRRGEEFAEGQVVFQPGTKVNAAVMGSLAALGIACPTVFRRPTVGLIATGSELVGVEMPLSEGKIRNSNSYMLYAQALEAGAQPIVFGETIDSPESITGMIRSAENCDIVLTTGGASVGDYDLISSVFAEQNITVLFERVGIKPGMPVIAGQKAGKLYIGLSGNPAAASIAFEYLVRPVLIKMGGSSTLQRPCLKARLLEPYGKISGVRRYVWAQWLLLGTESVVRPLASQSNGMLSPACNANSLIEVPPGNEPLKAGMIVDVYLL